MKTVFFAVAAVSALAALVQAREQENIDLDPRSCAAIAYSPSTGEYRYACDFRSRSEAEKAALAKCTAADARVVCWVKNGILALALGDDKTCWGTGWRYGGGANNINAGNTALEECRKRTTNPWVVVVLSSDGQRIDEYGKKKEVVTPPPAGSSLGGAVRASEKKKPDEASKK